MLTEKQKQQRRQYRLYNPGRNNRNNTAYMRRKRGLPEPTRPCPKVCECCGKPSGKRALHLDHDHITGKFRGWICGACNRGIGLLGDTIVGAACALEYLYRSIT